MARTRIEVVEPLAPSCLGRVVDAAGVAPGDVLGIDAPILARLHRLA
jgi:hypothetical protein